jgi:Mlc titration factor MtfA (ptsG expression regulator)
VIILILLIFSKRKRRIDKVNMPENFRALLTENVAYYRSLNENDKIRFENKIKEFLSYVRIHGVNTEVDELDKLLVASSAVIPVFGFDWHYYNLKDVLIYADTFNMEEYSVTAKERNILGVVGTGAMQRMMILSKPALRRGFQHETDGSNTGIHEFVHLLDKADGEADGIPEQLLHKQYTIPWIKYMSEEIEKIREGNSDINTYGAANRAEFFAVAAEYFFEKPDLFKARHPELFDLMKKVFHQEPATMKRIDKTDNE